VSVGKESQGLVEGTGLLMGATFMLTYWHQSRIWRKGCVAPFR